MNVEILLAIALAGFLIYLMFVWPAWKYSGQLVPKMRARGKNVSRLVIFMAVTLVILAYFGGFVWALWRIMMTEYQGFLFLLLLALLTGVISGTITYFLIAQFGLLPPITLTQLSANSQTTYDNLEARKKGKENMLVGGAILLFGLGVTIMTWKAAQQGGTYAILYGAIFLGAAQFLKGFSQYRQL
jgi:hypothetical protein